LSGLSYNFREQRVGQPDEEDAACHRYYGCALGLLPPPSNTCDYVTCYGEGSELECGTHKLHRLGALEKGKAQKKSKVEKIQEIEADSWKDEDLDEDEAIAEEEAEILQEIA
jgi:hypothetical protein